MANIWMDKRDCNENRGQLFASNAKQFMSARKHSSKKQVFGELKNVIHNQGDATPFKGAIKKVPIIGGPSKSSLCADVLRKQQLKQNFWDAQKQLEKKLKPTVKAAPAPALKFSIAEDAPWDDIDLSLNTCSGDCHKSLEEIWGEMNLIDDAFLQKVIDGGDPDSDCEEDKDFPKESDDEIAKIGALEFLRKPILATPEEDEKEDDYDDSRPLFKFEMPKQDIDLLDIDFAF